MKYLYWIIAALAALYFLYSLSFILFQRYIIFHPKKLDNDHPFNSDVPFEEITVKAGDGTSLHGLLLLPAASKGIVIYFHGNWENLENYLPFTKNFTRAGYSVLIPDYRGYGKSEGCLNEKNFYSDNQSWYGVASAQFPKEHILIYGRSLGTAAATQLAASNTCSKLILETPFFNMYDIARRYCMPFPDGTYLNFNLRTDLNLPKVKAPVLILHGTKDETVSIKSARKLKKYLKPGDVFVEIKNGKHKTLDQFEDYHKALFSFLNESPK